MEEIKKERLSAAERFGSFQKNPSIGSKPTRKEEDSMAKNVEEKPTFTKPKTSFSSAYPPDEVIQKHKDNTIREKSPSLIWSFITTIITAVCFNYCWTHESSTERVVEGNIFTFGKDITVTDYHYSWYFVGFLFLLFASITLTVIGSYFESKDKVKEIKNLSLHEYYNKYMRK